MMKLNKLSFSSLQIYACFIFFLVLALNSVAFGFVYLASCIPFLVVALLNQRKDSKPYKLLLLFSLILFFIFNIRPVFLFMYPEYYKFSHLDDLTFQGFSSSLLLQSLFISAILYGIWLGLKIKVYAPSKNKMFYFKKESRINLYIYLMFLLGLNIFFFVVMGVGVKGAESGGYQLIKFFLPTEIIMPIIFSMYVIAPLRNKKYKFENSLILFLLVSCLGYQLMLGSKEGIFTIVICMMVLKLLYSEKNTFSLLSLIAITIILPSLIAVSFIAANLSKHHGIISMDTLRLVTYINEDIAMFIVDKITQRLNGFDGTLGALHAYDPAVKEYLNFTYSIKSAISKLIPGVSLTQYSMGKAIGIYFWGWDSTFSFGGALGLVGIYYIFFGAIFGVVAIFATGLIFGVITKFIIKNSYVYYESFFLLCIFFNFGLLLSGGNIDLFLQTVAALFIQIFIYLGFTNFIIKKRPYEK